MSSAPRPRVWWLNLDAERELADPSAHVPSQKVLRQIAARAARFAPELCLGDGYVVPGGASGRGDRSAWVLAWCPTPGARKDIAIAGFEPPVAPSAEVLRAVNDRRFAFALARSAPLVSVEERLNRLYPATSAFEAARSFQIDIPTQELGEPVRLKRRYGFAGKGQRRHPAGRLAAADESTLQWLQSAMRHGGFVLEPEVDMELELSLHGLVDQEILLGRLCEQRCDAFGAPLEVRPAAPGRVSSALEECLRETAWQAASSLRDAGYFGPFGIDARLFRWRGQLGVQAIGDLNARFTLGWSTGMASLREAALAALLRRAYPSRHS